MRLRLAVHRNGLPPALILWNTNGLRPNHHASGPNTTVAQFLDQVNEVVPLETEDWGLEDYAVEVQGFECLHYSLLNQIFKDEDQVIIRPLQQADRRSLRISGRHQISADGRHLIDGVAFGRPFLKRTDRPPIRIPSVKRPRLVYDDTADIESEVNGSTQLVLRENGEDELGDDADGEHGYLASSEGPLLLENGSRHSQRLTSSRKRRSTGLGIGVEAPQAVHTALSPSQRRRNASIYRSESPSRRSSRSSTKSVRFDGHDIETPATVLAPEESEEEDGDFDPDDMDSESSASNKENVEPVFEELQEENASSAVSSSDTSDSEIDSETSSSESDLDSESESESDSLSLSSSSSSSMTSSVSSNSRISNAILKHPQGSATTKQNLPKATTSESLRQASELLPEPQSAPGNGTLATKKRNARKRKKLQAQRAELNTASLAQESKPSTEQTFELQATATSAQQEDNDVDSLEAKKLSLLQAIGPVVESQASPSEQNRKPAPIPSPRPSILAEEPAPKEVLSSKEADVTETLPHVRNAQVDLQSQVQQDAPTAESQTAPEEADARSQARRSKLDTASTKRLIFGSLGLRTPKNKQEEDALRNRLKPKAKDSLQKPVPESEVESNKQTVNQDDSSWEDHLVLKAVECCHDGIELSTPPFPFVQRWDPQQQGMSGNSRGKRGGGKAKRQKRNNSQYYQEEYNGFDDYDYDQSNVQVAEPSNVEYENLEHNNRIANPLVSFTDPEDPSVIRPLSRSESERTQAAVNQQIFQDASGYSSTSQAFKGLDLPELPSDVTKCDILSASSAKEGAIIAFKQMEMSEKTNWCPIISPFRTAKIESVLKDGSVTIVLAGRDVPSKQKKYDPETGGRVYDRFEMPSDDEEAEQDDSRIELSLLDMIEPKLIRNTERSPNKQGDDQPPDGIPNEEELASNSVPMTANPQHQEHQPASAQSSLNNDLTVKGMSESTRREYSLLMKDAGFRSDVAANISEAFAQDPETTIGQDEESNRLGSRFQGDASELNEWGLEESGRESGRSFHSLDPLTSLEELHQGTQESSGKHNTWGTNTDEGRDGQTPGSSKSSQEDKHRKPTLDGPSSSKSPYRSPEDEYDEQEIAESSLLPSESADPELFPISAPSPEIPFTSSPPDTADFTSTKHGNHSQGTVQESSVLGEDSFSPSPGQILSQPKARSRKTDEDWDAEYVPPSTAPAGLRSSTRNKNKRPTRRAVFAIPSSPMPSDDSQPDRREGIGSKPSHRSYGLDGTDEVTDDDLEEEQPKSKRRHPSPKAKTESTQVPTHRSFPSTAPDASIYPIDLTMSSDLEATSGKINTGAKDGTKPLGLPRGPGWVSKARPRDHKRKDRVLSRTRSNV